MYTAIIVEPRKHAALAFVLNTILSNLSNDWNIVICHGTNNIQFVQSILDNELSDYKHRITLVNIGFINLTVDEYCKLFATPSFYKYIPTEMFLVFQTDSMIFKKYASRINDFLKYDYVGAPWRNNYPGQIGNGGFSLRRKSKMLEIIAKVPYKGEPEDLYFSMAPISVYKPTFDEAKLFSVEQCFSPVTIGCHQVWVMPHYNEFSTIFPEVKTLQSLQYIL